MGTKVFTLCICFTLRPQKNEYPCGQRLCFMGHLTLAARESHKGGPSFWLFAAKEFRVWPGGAHLQPADQPSIRQGSTQLKSSRRSKFIPRPSLLLWTALRSCWPGKCECSDTAVRPSARGTISEGLLRYHARENLCTYACVCASRAKRNRDWGARERRRREYITVAEWWANASLLVLNNS